MLAALAGNGRGAARTVLVITPTGRAAEDLASALRCYLEPGSVVEFPAWETLPHERLSPRGDTVGRRLAVLRRLAHPGDSAVAGPVRAVLQPVSRGSAISSR